MSRAPWPQVGNQRSQPWLSALVMSRRRMPNTEYDHKHILSIIVCSTAKSGDGIGARPYRHSLASMSTANPARAPRLRQSFGAGDIALELPYFASMFELAPYLWGMSGLNEVYYRARSGVRSSRLSATSQRKKPSSACRQMLGIGSKMQMTCFLRATKRSAIRAPRKQGACSRALWNDPHVGSALGEANCVRRLADIDVRQGRYVS